MPDYKCKSPKSQHQKFEYMSWFLPLTILKYSWEKYRELIKIIMYDQIEITKKDCVDAKK